MPNIFGTKPSYLSNPLTEDLQANNFNGYNFNELHTDELHDNTGTGKIVVHEEFNMTNKKISNLADPTQFKDAVNIDYLNSRLSSLSLYSPYDLYVAVTDETTAIPAGIQPIKFNVPRNFILLNIIISKKQKFMFY